MTWLRIQGERVTHKAPNHEHPQVHAWLEQSFLEPSLDLCFSSGIDQI